MVEVTPPLKKANLTEIANQLSALADGLRTGHKPSSCKLDSQGKSKRAAQTVQEQYLNIALQTYGDRRRREAILGNSAILGEPAWDILLDLYIAKATAKEVSVSSACIGSAAPATTGLRWLGVLQEAGLIIRINDDDDHRRVLVQLSAEGAARMNRYFAEITGAANPHSPQRLASDVPTAWIMERDKLGPPVAAVSNDAHELQSD